MNDQYFALKVAAAVASLALLWIGGIVLGLVLSYWVGSQALMILYMPFFLGLLVFIVITVIRRLSP